VVGLIKAPVDEPVVVINLPSVSFLVASLTYRIAVLIFLICSFFIDMTSSFD